MNLTQVPVSMIDLDGSSFTGNFRNKIINGNFDVWQRGTSLASGTGERYLADRFANYSAGSTYTASQQSFALGQTNVPGEPVYFHRTVVTSVAGTNNHCILEQKIESVRTLAGRTATLSFYAKADAAKNIAVEIFQDFGSGGSPSTYVTTHVTKVSLTTSWQKITATVNIPSISGKTVGTNGNHALRVIFFFDAGSGFNLRTNSLGHQSGTFDIARVQLEEGLVATPFEERFMGTELALCWRYTISSEQAITANSPYTSSSSVSDLVANVTFPVMMRATPSITLGTQTTPGAGIAGSITKYGFRYEGIIGTVNTAYVFSGYLATAEL